MEKITGSDYEVDCAYVRIGDREFAIADVDVSFTVERAEREHRVVGSIAQLTSEMIIEIDGDVIETTR